MSQSGSSREAVSEAMIQIVGYRVPAAENHPFVLLHDQIYGSGGGHKRSKDFTMKDQQRYSRFVHRGYAYVSRAYRACALHRDAIAEMEAQTHDAIVAQWPAGDRGSLGVGDTVRLDAHYHAFLFAFRSGLDFFAGGAASCFKAECASFRRLTKALRGKEGAQAKHLVEIVKRYMPQFRFVVTQEGVKSLRDRAAHKEFLKPVHVIATIDGLRLGGGREALPLSGDAELLSELLTQRLALLNSFLLEAYAQLVVVDWP